MTHLDEGTIVAVRDGALVTGEARVHAGECAVCGNALEEASRASVLIAGALSRLDGPIDVEAAKAAVRARLDSAPERNPDGGRRAWHLGRAAAVLLLTAGVAYALPGSPIRGWLSDPDRGRAGTAGTVADLEAPTQERGAEGGIVVNVPDGRIQVRLAGVVAGTEIEVVWRDVATTRIVASPGSRFSFAEGLAEATVAPGPVRVELPRYAPVVSLEVDGRTYLRRSSGPLEVLEPAFERTEDRIRFLVPQR